VTRPGWYLDETTHAGPEHLEPEYVAGYDRKSAFDPAPDLQVLRGLGLGAGSTLIDVGAGTGTFSLAAAPYCKRVIALDPSPAMVEVLVAKARKLNVTNVEVVNLGILEYERSGELVDFVYSKNALHHLPDFWKAIALGRIAAFMKPGGVFRLRDLVYSFDPKDAAKVFEAWLSGVTSDPAAGWTRPELETHIRGEFSTYSWLLEPMLTRAGFEIRDLEYAESKVFAAYTCVVQPQMRVMAGEVTA